MKHIQIFILLFSLGCSKTQLEPNYVGRKVQFVGTNRIGVIVESDGMTDPLEYYKVSYFDDYGVHRCTYVKEYLIELIPN